MGEKIKVVVIGGGSSYTLEIIKGLIEKNEDINIGEVCLVDIKSGEMKQEILASFGRKMIANSKANFKITTSIDRRDALNCADFVITQFRVGGIEERINDEKVSFINGVIGDEKLGAAALSLGLRTIPVFLDIISDVKEICSDAFVINFTNPIGMIIDAVVNETGFKNIIGVSILASEMTRGIASILELDKSVINIGFAGVSNILYALSINANRECYNTRLLEKLDVTTSKLMPFSSDFAKGLDAIPCVNHRYYYKKEQFLENGIEECHMGITRGQIVKGIEEGILRYCENEENIELPRGLNLRKGSLYKEALMDVIDGIINDRKSIQVLNTMNNGVISDLYENDSVEVNCIVDSNGVRPLSVGRLPIGIKPLIIEIKSFEKLCIEAAIAGNYYKAYQALCINQLVSSDEKAKKILDEFLINNKAYLPNFEKKIKDIERTKKRKICKRDCGSCRC
ncbi:6-phospho-beta-glucosidase [uncultured Clostridium sp.]|jgi:6-phospho-beta-glucosidase|uniref:family 4 glycosyl hydrolase n=1 Tax=uncultured Clostridium sp. TaxID=59620 RepID=UPI0026154DCB|nr:6-phospho-beta-glucosidase [uncultured Clostridium sp.]